MCTSRTGSLPGRTLGILLLGLATVSTPTIAQPPPTGAPERPRPGLSLPPRPTGSYFLYELEKPDLATQHAQQLARVLGVRPFNGQPAPRIGMPMPERGVITFHDQEGPTRMVYREQEGFAEAFPHLQTEMAAAPARPQALQLAEGWLRQNALMPGDAAQFRAAEVTTTTKQAGTPQRKAAPVDVLHTVHFHRMLDGLRVYGPTSILSVDVGAKGVDGFVRTLRPLRRAAAAQIRPKQEAQAEFLRAMNPMVSKMREKTPETQLEILSNDLIYYEQGKKYAQPAYLITAQITGRNGIKTGYVRVIPALRQSPEPIMEGMPGMMIMPNTQPRAPQPQRADAAPVDDTAALPAFCGTGGLWQANPVQYGMYIVRDDDSCWLNDAWSFHTSVDFWNTIIGHPWYHLNPTHLKDYYWDEPWCWEAALGVPDESRYYVGTDDMVLIEGHGAPWEITTEKNCCDVIDLTKIAGYGGFNGSGGVTSYVAWHSCDVIPAPGDSYGGNYQSPASPWDVWWKIFNGMRGNYGYHTTMFICDGVGGNFGQQCGMGVANLNGWFHSIDNNVFGHLNGWDYGSAVIISGHENDCIYDTTPATANSLTIWWQHP